jgi:hypothetical protein
MICFKGWIQILFILNWITACILVQQQQVEANSVGAPLCNAGNLSVVDSDPEGITYHVDNGGSLSDYGNSVVILGTQLIPGQAFQIPTNQDVIITLNGQHKGVMMRLQHVTQQDLTNTFNPIINTPYQIMVACTAPVVGITHNDSEIKMNSIIGTFSTVGVVGNVIMDVTIVSVRWKKHIF